MRFRPFACGVSLRKALPIVLVLLMAGSVYGFFPGKPPTPPGQTFQGGGGGTPPNGGGPPPWTPGPPGGTPGGTSGGGGGGGGPIPEIDPGAIAGALGLLLCGSLMLADRRLRNEPCRAA